MTDKTGQGTQETLGFKYIRCNWLTWE